MCGDWLSTLSINWTNLTLVVFENPRVFRTLKPKLGTISCTPFILPMASKKEGDADCSICKLLNLETLTGATNCFSEVREAETTTSCKI